MMAPLGASGSTVGITEVQRHPRCLIALDMQV